MATFAYDPSRSFRGWLKTLTHHAWRDLVDDVSVAASPAATAGSANFLRASKPVTTWSGTSRRSSTAS